MKDWSLPGEEAAIKGGLHGRYWHRLRSARVSEEVDGIPVIRSWIQCRARIRLVSAVTRWGRPSTDACPSCWYGLP